jgi:hypothetical protein
MAAVCHCFPMQSNTAIHAALAILLLLVVTTASNAVPAEPFARADFEGGLPGAISCSHVACKPDTTRAHAGRASLRVTPAGRGGGILRVNLEGSSGIGADCEFCGRPSITDALTSAAASSPSLGTSTATTSSSSKPASSPAQKNHRDGSGWR